MVGALRWHFYRFSPKKKYLLGLYLDCVADVAFQVVNVKL